jgi:hypothetical protein
MIDAPPPTRRLETFELDLRGGAIEDRFRVLRPYVDQLPWGSLELTALSQAERDAARRGWTDLALQEYGAAASQANVLRLVVRARAPLDVSAMLANFPLDELAHTEICARMAAELGGSVPIAYRTEAVFPGPCAEAGSPRVDAATAVAWEFCVGETLSLGLLKSHHRHATHPLIRAVWGRLAKDEAAHARFGWVFLRWAMDALDQHERGQVVATVERAVARVGELDAKVLSLPPEAFVHVGVFGGLGRDAYLAETRRVLEDEVVRRLSELL